jgi:tRNA 2-thiouridine synthesizing protein E
LGDLKEGKMPKKVLGGMEIEIDEEGFIQEPEKWNQAIAEDLAKFENAYPLSEDHWKVINYLRNFYLKSKIAPPVRMLCKQTGFNLKHINQLFPNGPAKGACKVAGLPKPTGCM